MRDNALCKNSQTKEVICSISRGCANVIMLAARDGIRAPRGREKKQLHRETERRSGTKKDAQPCHGSLSRPGITSADRRVISSRRPRCWVALMARDIHSTSASSPKRIIGIKMATVIITTKMAGRVLVYGSVS